MSHLSFRRPIVALVLGMILASSWGSAAELRSRAERRPTPTVTREVPGVFGQLWGMFAGFLSKAGGSADPDGRSLNSVVTADAGCSIDPFGRCVRPAITADAGCSLDPNGRCVSGH
jgi:hypothetical protein